MGDEYKNIAKDRARVGLQIGQVHGNANHEEAPARTSRENLQVMIEELRTELRASRHQGSIDADSADAVEQELNEAADCLPVSDDESKSKFVVAMKKTNGLVEGLAGLTTKVAGAIAAVHGLQ